MRFETHSAQAPSARRPTRPRACGCGLCWLLAESARSFNHDGVRAEMDVLVAPRRATA